MIGVAGLADRQRRAEFLVAPFILAFVEFRLAQAALQIGEQVAKGLLVVPHMGAGADTAAFPVKGPFPCPEPAVGLPEHGGGF